MLFLRKIFSLKKDIFLKIIFLNVMVNCWNTPFSINSWPFFNQRLLKILLEILPNFCQLITYIAFLLTRYVGKKCKVRAICKTMKCKQCCLWEHNSSCFIVLCYNLSVSNNHLKKSHWYLQYWNWSMCWQGEGCSPKPYFTWVFLLPLFCHPY